MSAEPDGGLDDEDRKLLTLARGAMARAEAETGAAVRDADGRTYAAGPVKLAALELSALQVAVAMAIASGASEFEAAVVVGNGDGDPGVAALNEVSADAYVVTVGTA